MNGPRIAVLILAVCQAGWAQESAEKPEAQLSYARIVVDETQPRCFAGGRSPFFSDRLAKGQIVRVGAQVGDFYALSLPQGVTGYVHKDFSTEPTEGMVQASGTNVSFRYRPKTSEVPAAMMPKGTALHFLADEDEWWLVRYPGAEAYIAAAEIELVEDTDEVFAGWEELAKTRRGEWSDAVMQREAAQAAAEELERQRGELAALVERLQTITQESTTQPDFSGLLADVDKLLAALPEETPEHDRATGLRAEIEKQERLTRAVYLVGTEAPKENRAAEILLPQPEDPLDRFDAVGWLRYERPFGRAARFALVKGGRMMFEVTCSSGRYDLSMLDGVEVGIVGSKSRPDAESIRRLDALKIEILKLPL